MLICCKPLGGLKPHEIYKGKFLPMSENIWILGNLIPRNGSVSIDRKFGFK